MNQTPEQNHNIHAILMHNADTMLVCRIVVMEVGSPGLPALNLIAVQPPVGTPTVFLFGGSTKLNLAGSFAGSKLPTPRPTTKKLKPWRWKGCDSTARRFVS